MFKNLQLKKIRNITLAGLAGAALVYSFQVTAITLNAAEARGFVKNISEMETQISQLELTYFELLNDLSLDEVQNNGKNVEYAKINEIKTVAYNF
ncbi:MAG: hypothetical protein PHC89_00220 [Candidatus Pacebacteria bacterium]|nr:hypothetical protein [Candidatus Paceibacterota bacterium]